MEKLDQYKDNLDASKIAEGMNAANSNAVRLAEDAELLFENGRFPSALSIAILSIEESGKCFILRELAIARDGKELKEAWKRYRSHTSKNVMWTFPELAFSGGRSLSDFSSITDEKSEHPYLLENLKQIGFYTDCLGKAHWSIPKEVIDKEITQSLVYTARLLAKSKTHSEKEIELWIKHIKPVWKSSMSDMKKGIMNWFNEMKSLGLIKDGNVKFSDFVDGQKNSNK